MKTTDLPSPAEAQNPELECLFDDPADPSELTVFAPGTDSLATEWLTIDWETARSLDRLR
ncbi:hypothetical protein [Haloplanus sp.]|uniref:hypothetical protein n=1 Tax=Haloplanus sp. TaxID=1961696 RepID=UPI00261EABAD|nr:hypothetical protein [Haloplanus sp.]